MTNFSTKQFEGNALFCFLLHEIALKIKSNQKILRYDGILKRARRL